MPEETSPEAAVDQINELAQWKKIARDLATAITPRADDCRLRRLASSSHRRAMSASTIPFEDRNGRIIKIPSNWTIKDAMKAGFTNFRLVKSGTPLKKHEWRNRE